MSQRLSRWHWCQTSRQERLSPLLLRPESRLCSLLASIKHAGLFQTAAEFASLSVFWHHRRIIAAASPENRHTTTCCGARTEVKSSSRSASSLRGTSSRSNEYKDVECWRQDRYPPSLLSCAPPVVSCKLPIMCFPEQQEVEENQTKPCWKIRAGTVRWNDSRLNCRFAADTCVCGCDDVLPPPEVTQLNNNWIPDLIKWPTAQKIPFGKYLERPRWHFIIR